MASLDSGKTLRIRADAKKHRFIGIWVVVVEGRVFVRSWSLKPGGWYKTVLKDPRCAIEVGNRTIACRAVRTRSARLITAVSRAYGVKYDSPGARMYVLGFREPRRRRATIELVPGKTQ